MSPATATLPEEKSAAATAPEVKSAPLAASDVDAMTEVTTIEAQHPWWPLVDFGELWRHREMLYSLTMREIMRRYKQTVLGAVWAVFPVLANTALVGVFFGPLLKDKMPGGLDISLFIFTGLLPWYLFANIMQSSAHSVTDHSDLVTRIYFPRLILPFAGIGDRLLDFVIGFAILGFSLLCFFGQKPSSEVVWVVPLVMLGLIAAGLGVGLITAAAGVAYRDVFHAFGLLVQFWFFATPAIFYPKDIIPAVYHPWLPVNPAFGLIDSFRNAMVGVPELPVDYKALFISLGVSFLLLLIGVVYFQRAQRNFSDVI